MSVQCIQFDAFFLLTGCFLQLMNEQKVELVNKCIAFQNLVRVPNHIGSLVMNCILSTHTCS